MQRPYEIPVAFRVINNQDEFQQAIDQVVAWIESSNDIENPGTVTKIDTNLLGRRRLAYEIKGQRDGHYVLFHADIDPRHLPELELNLKLYDPILRYLIMRHEDTEEEQEEAEAEEEVAE